MVGEGWEQSGTLSGSGHCEVAIGRWTEAKERCWEGSLQWASKNLLVFKASGIHETDQENCRDQNMDENQNWGD